MKGSLILCGLLIFGASDFCVAQSIDRQVFGTFGSSTVSNNLEVDFTAGEPLTETLTSIDFMATQGFHQPFVSPEDKLEIYFPNTFNPISSIGTNTTFHPVYAENVTDYYFAVYSRWRNKVFETNDISSLESGWDGTYNGEPVPSGVYVYTARFVIKKYGETETHEVSGVVHVVR